MGKNTDNKDVTAGKDPLVLALCGAIPDKGEIQEASRRFVEEGLKMSLAGAGVCGTFEFRDNPVGVEAGFDYGIDDCHGYTTDVRVDVVVARTGIVAEASAEYGHGDGFRREEIGTFGGFAEVVGRLCHWAMVDAMEMDMAWEKKNLEYVRGKLESGEFGK